MNYSFVLSFIILNFFSVEDNSMKDYFLLTNKAEMLIVDENYHSAICLYDSAFVKNPQPFAKDIINALQCAVIMKNNNKSYDYAKMAISIGCDIKYFKKQQNLSSFTNTKKWLELVKEYEELRTQFSAKCNWKLRHKLEELVERDQFWRGLDPSYTILKDSTFREDSLIMLELIDIFKDGYPNPYEVGIFIEDDTTITTTSHVPLILLHNYCNHRNYKKGVDLTKRLSEFVILGVLSPDNFGYLNDRSGEYQLGSGFAQANILWKLNGDFYFEKIPEKTLLEINERRIYYGLCSIEESRIKALYQLEHKGKFDFFESAFLSSVDMPEAMIKNFFTPVKK